MSVAATRTVTLQGAVGHVIDVQVDISQGLIRTAVVGRPDLAINEARDRVRAAIDNGEHHWPSSKRVTILLSPADIPKSGPHFDLAIAVAVLTAMGKVAPTRGDLANTCFIGELTLDGRLRPVPGVLAMTMAAARRGITQVIVPEPQADEAALVPGVSAWGMRSLEQVTAYLEGSPIPEAEPVEARHSAPLLQWRGERRDEQGDLADVLGMHDERFSLEVAAAGGHHLMLMGAKGAGKTTLAERLPGILPDLTAEESLELTAINSLAGEVVHAGNRAVRPPFRAPHHSISRTALLGGGSGRVRPGEVSRAHLGALFLDEFPHYPSDVIDALRQPLEKGEVTIARGEECATFPARTIFVLAANPCPCGEFSSTNRDNRCDCAEVVRRNYRRKVTGPVVDRVDIWRHVEAVKPHELTDPLELPEPTALVRARVELARERQAARYAETPWRLNADVPGPELTDHWPLAEAAAARLEQEVFAGRITRRGASRVHRVAWTVTDLRGLARPGMDELNVALRLRHGAPLDLDMLRRGGAA